MNENDIKRIIAILKALKLIKDIECIECCNCSCKDYQVECPAHEEPLTLLGVESHLAEKIGWKREKLHGYLTTLYGINPMSVVTIILKEAAIMLDHKYEGHISKSDEIYYISTLNGKVGKTSKDNIVSYRNFAAFRTLDDALEARALVADYFEKCYGCQQED